MKTVILFILIGFCVSFYFIIFMAFNIRQKQDKMSSKSITLKKIDFKRKAVILQHLLNVIFFYVSYTNI